MISSCVRCIPLWFPSLGNTSFNVLCHAGAVLNGLSGPVAMSAPIQISAAWFPPNERTRATSIGQMFNALGVGVSYLLGRFLVSTDDDVSDDESDETSITALLSVYSGVSLFLLTASLLYYPSKPVSPPSVSAGEERTGISSSWRQLIRSKSVSCIIIIIIIIIIMTSCYRNCWLVTMCYALSQALVQMWQSTMVINFANQLDMSEKWSSTLGIFIGFSSVASSILVATFIDFFRRRMKLSIIILLGLSLIFSTLIALISEKVIHFDSSSLSFKAVLYILSILAVSLACSAAPITFEFCAELCYPVAEGILG